jgi:hypothetical protein
MAEKKGINQSKVSILTFSTIRRHCVPLPEAGAPEIITFSGASTCAAATPSAARHRRSNPYDNS